MSILEDLPKFQAVKDVYLIMSTSVAPNSSLDFIVYDSKRSYDKNYRKLHWDKDPI
jgi:hypothetical protein